MSDQRKELDISLLWVSVIALLITAAIYFLLFPFQNSYLGILLYQRGYTQHLAIFMASVVATVIILKYIKLQKEFRYIKRNVIAPGDFSDHKSKYIANLQQKLASEKGLISRRCWRVIAAYANSGSRQTATELALDDSAFYQSNSESSYALPRILVWAIPLLGFIGTVVGISIAVNGFSGFLQEAAEVEKIKEGIGIVTSGLATAFDTTLLALLLSVVVMIPLVLVERLESRLLLTIDIYINDNLLPKLTSTTETQERNKIKQVVRETIQESLPSQQYLKQTAQELVQTIVKEIQTLQQVNTKLLEQIEQLGQLGLEEHQMFIASWQDQQKVNQHLTQEINALITDIKTTSEAIATGLTSQTENITQQLNTAAKLLEERLMALERSTDKVSEVIHIQESLNILHGFVEKASQIEPSLVELQANIVKLQPTLEKMSKPRRLTLVEQLDSDSGDV